MGRETDACILDEATQKVKQQFSKAGNVSKRGGCTMPERAVYFGSPDISISQIVRAVRSVGWGNEVGPANESHKARGNAVSERPSESTLMDIEWSSSPRMDWPLLIRIHGCRRLNTPHGSFWGPADQWTYINEVSIPPPTPLPRPSISIVSDTSRSADYPLFMLTSLSKCCQMMLYEHRSRVSCEFVQSWHDGSSRKAPGIHRRDSWDTPKGWQQRTETPTQGWSQCTRGTTQEHVEVATRFSPWTMSISHTMCITAILQGLSQWAPAKINKDMAKFINPYTEMRPSRWNLDQTSIKSDKREPPTTWTVLRTTCKTRIRCVLFGSLPSHQNWI